jgi:hypothetical protein
LLGGSAYGVLASCVSDEPNAVVTIKEDGGDLVDSQASDGSKPPDNDATPSDAGSCDPLGEFSTVQQVTSLNTAESELQAWFSPDEKTVYLTAIRADGGDAHWNIFTASRAKRTDPFGKLTVLAKVSSPSVPENEQGAAVTDDGNTLYAFSNRTGTDRIYVATRTVSTTDFGTLAPVSNIPSGAAKDSLPWISGDGNTMYFVSNRDNAANWIYRTDRVGVNFDTPKQVTELASGSGEGFPVLSADQRVIYFASLRTGDGVLGGNDIWMAARPSNPGTFVDLKPVTKINSNELDVPLWISPDNCRLYLASGRAGVGAYDIWMAERVP